MPAQGAAILSQIEGLLEQLTELDYDSPVKAWAEQLMPEVRQQAEDIRAQAGGEVLDTELEEGTDDTGAMPPRSPEAPAMIPEEEPDGDPTPKQESFAEARSGAKAYLAQAKAEEEQPEEKKKKKAKAA